MTTDNLTTSPGTFGNRLKTARELMGLEQKDVAAQLRLSEKYIAMMENDHFSSDLPVTFARGYLRAYGKFLQIPEWEVKKALEFIQPKETPLDPLTITKHDITVTSGNYFMQLFTYLIVLTMLGLAGTWWYRHTPSHTTSIAENRPTTIKIVPANTIATAVAPTPNTTVLPTQTQPLALQATPPSLPTSNTPAATHPPVITEAMNTKPKHSDEENEVDGDEAD
jgi:cytoskeleton protein RodZ